MDKPTLQIPMRSNEQQAIELQGNITKKNITNSSDKIQAEHVVRKLLQ